ncbi:MAG: DNA-deoxyinosine glycosylase [Firmicutes bacterium]|nr:DNA-deoxyinosine glycosylase [Bacillota bacterium]
MEKHTLEPFYNEDSEILILGSFPSVKSRDDGFYYAHPKNRFWQILSVIYNEELIDIETKKTFLIKHKIALYDVCASCDIEKSKDASIKNVKPNNIGNIIKKSNIKKIYVNGKTAYNLYNKLIRDKINIDAIYLPSTSPANAKFKLEDLVQEYSQIKDN